VTFAVAFVNFVFALGVARDRLSLFFLILTA